MMISASSRALFVHVQKSGGSTIDNVLEQTLPDAERLDRLGRHARLRRVLHVYPHLASFWIFGFVRNPWARMYSWFSMIERIGAAAADGNEDLAARIERNRLWKTVLADYPDFEQFVLRGTREVPTLGWPQISYLRSGGRSADFIGRQERFDEDMRVVLDRLEVEWPGDIPHYNAGESRGYRDAYTPTMRDRVAEAFSKDLHHFGYEF